MEFENGKLYVQCGLGKKTGKPYSMLFIPVEFNNRQSRICVRASSFIENEILQGVAINVEADVEKE